MQKLKNNEAGPKFTGSYKKKRVATKTPTLSLTEHSKYEPCPRINGLNYSNLYTQFLTKRPENRTLNRLYIPI